MKAPLKTFRSLRPLRILTAIALLTSTVSLRAAEDIVIDTFDTDTAGQWSRWWGCATQAYAWDASVDAGGNSSSGSLKVTIDFNLAGCSGENQFAAVGNFSLTDGSQYTNLVFDLRWDPSSPRRASGDFGWLEPGFRNQDFSQNWLPPFAVSTNEGWLHIVLPINPTAPKIEAINGIALKMWSGDGASGFTGTATFWVDNIKLIARPSNVTNPPPTLTIEKPAPGLKIIASAPGSQYQRQSIRTVNPAYSWVGATEPVTYSMTINDFPGGNYSGFQAHLFLAPNSNIPTFENSPDWNQTNIIFLQIQNNADGSAYAAFRYKTNLPNGNSMLFGNGAIGDIGAPNVKGTWDLTFSPTGNITLTAPNGASTNFTMPPDAVTLFSGPAYAYFGVQPNQPANIGQAATFGRFQISGLPSPIDETFTTATLNSSIWQVIAEDAAGVLSIPPDSAFWLIWTLPDQGFGVQWSEAIADDFWLDLPVSGSQIGNRRAAQVLKSQLPVSFTDNYFFRLAKPQ